MKIKDRLSILQDTLSKAQGRKDYLEEKLNATQKDIKNTKRDIKNGNEALLIIRKVAEETQKELEYYISEIPTLALSAVFKDPYTFKVDFVQRRDKTESDLSFVRDDNEINPMEASGLGAVDVASFGLRPALWNLQKPRTRNVFILDEAFKHLKGYDENVKVIQIIKELSDKLGIQIIMVHDERVPMEEIEKGADRIFSVSMKNYISEVEVL